MTREWTSPDGRMRLLNMDCMEFVRGCKDGEFDLAVVDPPYGIDVANNTTGTVIRNKSDKDIFVVKSWDKAIPDELYFVELKRLSKNQIVWGGNYFLDYLGYCKAPIVWDKLNGQSMYADGELAWTSSGLPRNLRIFKHQWCGAFKDSERSTTKIHPTQKPVALYRWLFQNYAKAGDRILDTHVGSASSFIAAWEKGFEIVGCELDADYFDAAVARIEKAMQQPALPFATLTPPQQHPTAQELF